MRAGITYGRALAWYVLPLAVVGIILLMVLGWYATWQIIQQERKNLAEQTHVMAASLADRVEEIVRARQETLGVVAQSSQIIAALQGDQATRDQATRKIQGTLPNLIRLRLFSAYFDDVVPDIHGVVPIGYAGIGMVKRAMDGQPTPVEVHQISSGTPYIAMTVAVKIGRATKGVLFAAWSLSLVKNAVYPTPRFPGRLHILQKSSDNAVLAGDPSAQISEDSNAKYIAINGTIWDVAYTQSPPEWQILGLFTFLIILVSLLLLAAGLQFNLLRRDLCSDMQRLQPYLNRIAIQQSDTPGFRLALIHQHIATGAQNTSIGPVASTPPNNPATRQNIPAHIFRAYDIRGLVGEELNAEIAYLLGQAFAERIKQQEIHKVYMAYDARLSSPQLAEALQQGLLKQGIDVADLGMSPVALLYHVMHQNPQSGAVMVSGSHNPPQYNGFKLYVQAQPLADLSSLLARMREAGFPAVTRGQAEPMDARAAYLQSIPLKIQRRLKMVVDAGNGAAGEIATGLLTQTGAEVIALYCQADGNFPHHHPDPNQPENLVDLSAKVLQTKADLGIAFDGDGDRIGLVDNTGQAVRPEHLLMLLAADLLQRQPQAKIVYDIKSSAHLAAYIKQQGGEPVVCESGYTRIWQTMQQTGAMLGGEFAGHYFIRENWHGADDAIYVAARLVTIISQKPDTLAQQLECLPQSPATPEYQMPLQEGEAPSILQALEKQLPPDVEITRIDGLKIDFGDAWGLVRSSNTLPCLSFRFEAQDEAKLSAAKNTLRGWIEQVAPDKPIPF